jgi:hypothetical protein
MEWSAKSDRETPGTAFSATGKREHALRSQSKKPAVLNKLAAAIVGDATDEDRAEQDYCYAKNKNVPEQFKGTSACGDVWTFTAICADTELVPTWLVEGPGAERGWVGHATFRPMAVSMEVECPVAGCAYVVVVTYPMAEEWERESCQMMQEAILDQEHPTHPPEAPDGAANPAISN